MERLTTVLADHRPVVAPLLIVLTTYTNFPLLGKEFGGSERRCKAFLTGAAQLYHKGYETFRDQPVRLTPADGDRILVPNSALEELRRLPGDDINSQKALDKAVERRFAGLGGECDLLHHVVRADLTRSLNHINPRLGERVARTVDGELGTYEDWVRTPIYQKLLQKNISPPASITPSHRRRVHCRTETQGLDLSAEAYWPVLIPELAKVFEHNQARFSRYVSKPITLSNGLHIPAGFVIYHRTAP
ncbi:putative Ent-kaurene oxidase [Seiridium cardinale]|uniref:Ent-kaurene oxidase n=1 Tax=Seiridium cardinale TaxID=138064 RepID=A0ABR2X8M3_9PEZI